MNCICLFFQVLPVKSNMSEINAAILLWLTDTILLLCCDLALKTFLNARQCTFSHVSCSKLYYPNNRPHRRCIPHQRCSVLRIYMSLVRCIKDADLLVYSAPFHRVMYVHKSAIFHLIINIPLLCILECFFKCLF